VELTSVLQPHDLAGMMSAMYPMKFSPFASGQGSKEWMLGYRLTPSKLGVAFGDYRFHTRDIFKNLRCQLRDRSASRQGMLRRFSAGGNIPKPNDCAALPALTGSIDAGTGFSRRQATLAVLNCAAVGLIQVVQYLRWTPFAFRMPRQVFRSHTVDGFCQPGSQIREF
jgi:hypothetical protein